jgi:hypothetical protein
MSKSRYNAVMSSEAGPTIAARFILSILADKAKDDGYCYPGPEWLARQAKCDMTTVRRAIKALNEEGSLLTRKNGADSFPKYEHLVLVGMNADEIETVLDERFGPDANRMISAIEEGSSLYFKGESVKKDAECPSENAECPSENAECPPKNAECPKKMQNALRSVKDPLRYPSKDPSVREPHFRAPSRARARSRSPFCFRNQQEMTNDLTANNSKALRRPEIQNMVTALYEACGKRPSRRNQKKFRASASRLWKDGFSVEQVTLTRRWWDTVGIGSIGGTPPWPEQIEENIQTAIRWAEGKEKRRSVEEAKMAPINTGSDLSEEQKRAIRASITARRAKRSQS